MKNFKQIYSIYLFILFFVLISGCAGTMPGLLNSLNKGQLIPSEVIERYKNMPDLVSQLAGSTGKIMDFMTANEIDSSEMKDQLSGVF